MVKITKSQDGLLEVSGKTYEHKEMLKQLGARWNNQRKCWVGITNTEENMKALKSLTTKRRCGHCGEEGHFKPKCEKFHEERKKELQEKSVRLLDNPGPNFKRLNNTGFCYCMFESCDFGYKGFSVPMPVVCGVCSHWCCSQARPMEEGTNFNAFRFDCPYHGNSFEQLMNDTRGT